MEALKAKGAGRRRRQKASPLMSENMPTAASVVQGATTAAAPTPSQLLNSLTEFLYSLLKTVEDLRSCTELVSLTVVLFAFIAKQMMIFISSPSVPRNYYYCLIFSNYTLSVTSSAHFS